ILPQQARHRLGLLKARAVPVHQAPVASWSGQELSHPILESRRKFPAPPRDRLQIADIVRGFDREICLLPNPERSGLERPGAPCLQRAGRHAGDESRSRTVVVEFRPADTPYTAAKSHLSRHLSPCLRPAKGLTQAAAGSCVQCSLGHPFYPQRQDRLGVQRTRKTTISNIINWLK